MSAERGEFFFDTNIEAIRQRIVGELGAIGRAVDSAEGRLGRSQSGDDFLKGYSQALSNQGARFLQGVQDLGNRTRQALAAGIRPPDVAKEMQTLGAEYKKGIESIQRSMLSSAPRELAGSSIFQSLTASATREAGLAGRTMAAELQKEFSRTGAAFTLPGSTFKSLSEFGDSKGLVKTLTTALPDGARASSVALSNLLDQVGRTGNGFRRLSDDQAALFKLGTAGKGRLGAAGLTVGSAPDRVAFTDPQTGDPLELRGRDIVNLRREHQRQVDEAHKAANAEKAGREAAEARAAAQKKATAEAVAAFGRRNLGDQLLRDANQPGTGIIRTGARNEFVTPTGVFSIDKKGEAQRVGAAQEAAAVERVAKARGKELQEKLNAQAKEEAATQKLAKERGRELQQMLNQAEAEQRVIQRRANSVQLAREIAAGEARQTAKGIVRSNGQIVDKFGNPITNAVDQYGALTRAHNQSQGKGLATNFLHGLTSRGFGGDGPAGLEQLALSAGVTAKYAALSTIIYGLTRVLGQGVHEVLDYRDSLTDLTVAFGDGVEASNQYQDSLSEVSRLSGANIGGALDSAARGIRAFANEQSRAAKEQAGFETARASNALALIANKDLKDATGDIIAIGNAYGVASDDLFGIVDAIAAAKDLGGTSDQIAQGLANVGVAFKEAGFGIQEAGDIISLVTAKTDQSGTLVATRLSRITSIIQSGGARDILAGLKNQRGDALVDVSASSRDQIVQLAAGYDKLSTAQQKTLRNRLGGTANVREFQVLIDALEKGGPLYDRFNKGVDASGRGTNELNRKSNDLVGTLRQIQGSISNIAVGLYRSGALAPLGVAVKALEPALKTIEDLLAAYRDLTDLVAKGIPLAGGDDLRNIIALGLEFMLVVKGIQALKAGGKAIDFTKDLLGVGAKTADTAALTINTGAQAANTAAVNANAAGRGRLLVTGPFEARMHAMNTLALNTETIAQERNTMARLRAAGTNIAGKGSSILGTVGGKIGVAAVAAVGVDMVWRGINDQIDRTTSSLEKQSKAQKELAAATDEATAQAAIKTLRAAADQRARVDDGFSNRLTGGMIAGLPGAIIGRDKLTSLLPFAGKSGEEDAESLREAAKIEQRRLKRLEQDRRNAAANGTAAVFGDVTDFDSISKGLEALDKSGKDATTTVNLLAQALGDGLGDKGGPGTVLPGQARVIGEKLAGSFEKDVRKGLSDYIQSNKGKDKKSADAVANTFVRNLNPETADPAKLAKLRSKVANETERFLKQAGVADGGQLTPEQQQQLAKRLAALYTGNGKQGDEGLRKTRRNIQRYLLGQIQDATDPANIIQDEDTNAQVQQIFIDQAQNVAKEAELRGGGDKVAGAQAALATLERAVALAGRSGFGATGDMQIALLEAKNALAEAQLEQANAIAEAGVDSRDVVGSATVEMENAKRSMDLIAAQGGTGTAAYADASKAYADAVVSLARTKVEESNAIRSANVAVGDAVGEAVADYQNAVALISTTLSGTAARAEAEKAAAEARQAAVEARVNRDNAVGAAAIDPRDTLAVSRQQIAALENELASTPAAAEQKRAELQLQINQARLSYTQEQIAYADAVRRADNFPGAAVSDARDSLANARDNLKAALPGTQSYYEAMRGVAEAQVALARAQEENQSVIRQLSGDITNPLFLARDELKQARQKLANDRRLGAPKEVLNQDRLAVEQAEASLEQTKFSQRLKLAQDNYELGRTSFKAYMNYLQSEHDRLSAIKDRTYQQQQQLNEIDKLMKDAKGQMDAQFNLGEIKLPTPYEVRRSLGLDAIAAAQDAASSLSNIKSFSVGGTSVQSLNADRAATQTNTQTVHIEISGADKAQVLAVLRQYLGPEATGRGGTTYRKG